MSLFLWDEASVVVAVARDVCTMDRASHTQIDPLPHIFSAIRLTDPYEPPGRERREEAHTSFRTSRIRVLVAKPGPQVRTTRGAYAYGYIGEANWFRQWLRATRIDSPYDGRLNSRARWL